MATNCGANEPSDGDQPAATTRPLPTCAQIGAVLKDFIEADSLEPVELVLTPEDIENATTCVWKDVPTGKSILIGASFGTYDIQKTREWGASGEQSPNEPESFLAEPDERGAEDAIFMINADSAEVYEPGCEVNLTYFTPTFSVRFIGDEYVIDQAKDAALRVAELMR